MMLIASVDPILPAALGSGVDSASNRNEFHKMFLRRKFRPEPLTASPLSVSQLS
jgi:hypothetical protein